MNIRSPAIGRPGRTSWNWHHFKNTSNNEPAIFFSVTDRPVLESLGLFREEEG
jgi:gentisate 1,2-dioxygenase